MKLIHHFEEMTPEKPPQDPLRDGSGLTFETLEHGGVYPDSMPQAILLTDAEGRSCMYVPQETAPGNRPQDLGGDGRSLQFETLEHAGEYPDDMPQLIKVTDGENRSCIYAPIRVKGRVVDSQCFELVPDTEAAEHERGRVPSVRSETHAEAEPDPLAGYPIRQLFASSDPHGPALAFVLQVNTGPEAEMLERMQEALEDRKNVLIAGRDRASIAAAAQAFKELLAQTQGTRH